MDLTLRAVWLAPDMIDVLYSKIQFFVVMSPGARSTLGAKYKCLFSPSLINVYGCSRHVSISYRPWKMFSTTSKSQPFSHLHQLYWVHCSSIAESSVILEWCEPFSICIQRTIFWSLSGQSLLYLWLYFPLWSTPILRMGARGSGCRETACSDNFLRGICYLRYNSEHLDLVAASSKGLLLDYFKESQRIKKLNYSHSAHEIESQIGIAECLPRVSCVFGIRQSSTILLCDTKPRSWPSQPLVWLYISTYIYIICRGCNWLVAHLEYTDWIWEFSWKTPTYWFTELWQWCIPRTSHI